MIDFQNQTPNILVIGDLMIDHYLWGSSKQISPEAPVPVVNIEKESLLLGGAGNVIKNLVAFGAFVDVISVIGDSDESIELKSMLSKININTQYLITKKNRITGKKSRIIAANQQVVRYDLESTTEIDNNSQNKIVNIYKKIIKNYDVILLSDYGKGVLTFELTQSLISLANKNGKKILVDPKGLDYSKYVGAYLLTPNRLEASKATNININDDQSLAESITKLKKQIKLKLSLITLSEQGIALLDKKLKIYPAVAREIFDVTGAGDTILASLGFALACGKNIDESIKFANLAAGVVVGKIGSASATLNEIIEYESSLNISTSDDHIKNWDEISSINSELKINGKTVVFTNGCFDILHIGHIKYLENAKKFGDILIVGLNSDNSTKRLKGKNRPINNEYDRAYLLASLEAVDYVVIFNEDTPLNLITLIKPDVLVKGGDYKGKDVVGQNIAKELKIVEFYKGKNTTQTIERIKKS